MGIFVVGPEKLIDSLEMDRSKWGRESFNLFQFITNIHIKLIRQRYAECHSQWQPSMNLCLSEMISKITSHQETSLWNESELNIHAAAERWRELLIRFGSFKSAYKLPWNMNGWIDLCDVSVGNSFNIRMPSHHSIWVWVGLPIQSTHRISNNSTVINVDIHFCFLFEVKHQTINRLFSLDRF